jgi:glycosyltransferase involved in cell wall biosynthesis
VAVAEGFDVDVIATTDEGESRFETHEGASIFRIPVSHERGRGLGGVIREYLGFTLLAALLVAKRSLRRRYDVVHVNNPPDFLIVTALVPRLLGARIIFDIHDLAGDMFDMRFGERPGAVLAERALRGVERLAAAMADVVLTVHEPYRRELVARGVRGDKLAVVMNSIDENLLTGIHRVRAADEFAVVYHGTVTPHYGVKLLVEAVGEVVDDIPDVHAYVYGEGDAVQEASELAAFLSVADRTYFSGTYLPHREVLEKIATASVGVIPNMPTRLNQYALSSKLFEYVALRIPVVASGLPTLREHFGDDELWFFTPGDSRSLAAALRDVARNPVAAAERAEAAYERYRAYRWDINARRYADLLHKLAP